MCAHKSDGTDVLYHLQASFLHRVQPSFTAPSATMETPLMPQSEHQVACGFRLRRLIDACEISYVRAAADMGVSKQRLGNWMRGDNYPELYALYRFARLRGVNTDYVFLGDWTNLPQRVAEKLQAEMLAKLEAKVEPADPAP